MQFSEIFGPIKRRERDGEGAATHIESWAAAAARFYLSKIGGVFANITLQSGWNIWAEEGRWNGDRPELGRDMSSRVVRRHTRSKRVRKVDRLTVCQKPDGEKKGPQSSRPAADTRLLSGKGRILASSILFTVGTTRKDREKKRKLVKRAH